MFYKSFVFTVYYKTQHYIIYLLILILVLHPEFMLGHALRVFIDFLHFGAFHFRWITNVKIVKSLIVFHISH